MLYIWVLLITKTTNFIMTTYQTIKLADEIRKVNDCKIQETTFKIGDFSVEVFTSKEGWWSIEVSNHEGTEYALSRSCYSPVKDIVLAIETVKGIIRDNT